MGKPVQIRLDDGLHNPHHRSLDPLVLEAGGASRSLLPLVLLDPDPRDWRRHSYRTFYSVLSEFAGVYLPLLGHLDEGYPRLVRRMLRLLSRPAHRYARRPSTLGLILGSSKAPDPKHVREAVSILQRLCSDSQAIVKFRAVQALGRFGPVRRIPLDEVVYADQWGRAYRDRAV